MCVFSKMLSLIPVMTLFLFSFTLLFCIIIIIYPTNPPQSTIHIKICTTQFLLDYFLIFSIRQYVYFFLYNFNSHPTTKKIITSRNIFLVNQEKESKRYFLNFVINLKSEIITRNHLMVLKPES